MDLRTLNLEIIWKTGINSTVGIHNIIEKFGMSSAFDIAFPNKTLDQVLDKNDENTMWTTLCKEINTEDNIYFVIWDADSDMYGLYYIRQKTI